MATVKLHENGMDLEENDKNINGSGTPICSPTTTRSPGSITKNGSANQWVRLNVGGQIFMTTKTTLSRDTNSFLARLIRDDSELISDQVKDNLDNLTVTN